MTHNARLIWRIMVSVTLTFVLSIPLAPGLAMPQPSAGPSNDAQVYEDCLLMDHSGLPSVLDGTAGLEVIDAYDNFLHLHAPSEVMERLRSMGFDLRPLDHLYTISFDAATFDTRYGEPQIPASMRDDLTDIYIVQVRGPSKHEWTDQLAAHGTVLDIVQYYSYLVRLSPQQAGQVEALDFVTWIGKYHPYYKVRAGFDMTGASLGSSAMVRAELVFFKNDPDAYGRAQGAIEGLGGNIILNDETTSWWFGSRISFPLSALGKLSRLDGLAFMEPYDDPTSRMDRVRWVVQSNDADNATTPVWDQGIHGEGIIVGGADTGIDLSHVAFRNSTSDVGTVGPDHRKVVQYNKTVDDWDDGSGHGTHTMGAIAGNNVSSFPGSYRYDGIAYAAKIAFYDVVLPDGTYDPPIMTDILQDAYRYGANSHSDSWGDDTPAYTSRAQRIDQFQWDHYEFLTFIAPGNAGVVWEPATAKNCVSVGNAYNGETMDIADSSAVGPANGNMTNPHIVVPGMSLISPQSDMDRNNSNWGYTPLSGTSMATPVAAGTTALIEQYFRDGFYPTGTKVGTDGFVPSGPLKKAALLNSGWDQFGGNKGMKAIDHIPNSQQGWGKVKLDDVLYFDGDNRGLWVHDGYNNSAGPGLMTGEKDNFVIHANSTEPLEVTLVWNDYPGQGLKNDLDLTVLDPTGSVFKGNNYQNGHSVAGGAADRANPTESVQIDIPVDGFYVINVTAANVQSQVYQRYAIVVTGAIHGADQGGVNFDKAIYGIKDKVTVRMIDSDLSGSGTFSVKVSSLKETTPETISLAETLIDGVFAGQFSLSLDQPKNDGVLQVNEVDTILVQYLEVDPPGTRVATAYVDAKPPVTSNVRVTDITNDSVTIRWDTDEPSDTNVFYGPSKALGSTKRIAALVTAHTIVITGLLKSTLYYFDVSSSDAVDNEKVDDNSGAHYSFRTASFILTAKPGFVGWVREGEQFNHFNDGIMYSGFYVNLKRFSVMHFNLSQVPENADFEAVSLKVYGRSRAATAPTGGTWSMELLDTDVNALFNSTSGRPTYNDIATANMDANLGNYANSELVEDQWMTFDAPVSDLPKFKERLDANGATFAIVGPTSGENNMFSWDTGNTADGNSLGPAYAPQLILTINLIPLVSPGAPSSIQMTEDKPFMLDLGTVFSDDGPLDYVLSRQPAHLDHNISNAVLNLTPEQDWNGVDYLIIKAIDEDGLFSEHRIDIKIAPVNDAPELVSIGGRAVQNGMILNATQDQTDTFPVVSSDVDIPLEGDLLFYETNLSWAKVLDGNLTISPTNDNVGTNGIKITVKDLAGQSDSVDAIIDVANVDDPPLAVISTPPSNYQGYTGIAVVLNGSLSSDPDLRLGDDLTFEWKSSVQGTLGTEAVLTMTMLAGRHTITLTVRDRSGSIDVAYVNITIWGDSDNDGQYDPIDPDDDGDGMPDYWELTYGLDPVDPADAKTDIDNDGYKNLAEYEAATDPLDPKSKPKRTPVEEGSWTVLALFVMVLVFAGLLVVYLMLRTNETKGTITGAKGRVRRHTLDRSAEDE